MKISTSYVISSVCFYIAVWLYMYIKDFSVDFVLMYGAGYNLIFCGFGNIIWLMEQQMQQQREQQQKDGTKNGYNKK